MAVNQKAKLLALREILLRESDEEHPLSAGRMVELLARQGKSWQEIIHWYYADVSIGA